MRAVLYTAFTARPAIARVDDPVPEADGVVIKVEASGLCRSDWHGWMGHDPDIALPHVPGHELAGVIVALGRDVCRWRQGDRVTVPFVAGCGDCAECHAGHQQVCLHQFQPGFTAWGSFAEYVAIGKADLNLVALPEAMAFDTAAALGCRFATAFRAVIDQGRVSAGQWVAVHGCGGLGLSAIMIANAVGAQVIGIDIDAAKLDLAQSLGAVACLDSTRVDSVPEAIVEISRGGAHLSLDALGHPQTCFDSVACLRTRGTHVQVGLLLADQSQPAIPMDRVVARELQLLGSHGIQAHRYPAMLTLIESGKLDPSQLVRSRITLDEAPDALMNMDRFLSTGATVITSFGENS